MSRLAKLRSGLGRRGWELFLQRAYPLADATGAEEGQPFPAGYAMPPHVSSKRYGWTHYGVMIPDLPAPHRFFSIMGIVGTPGALAFDNDHALKDTPRRNATVVSGTAATHPAHFGSYSIDRDCEMLEDGSLVRFGKEVEIGGGYPEYRVRAEYAGFRLDLEIRNTDKVSWFMKTPVYDHFSLLSQYRGQLRWRGKTSEVAGLCTFEYAACFSPYQLRDKPLAPALKLPLDFFTYQIINLDRHTQLLLTRVTMGGATAVSRLYVRSLDGYGVRHDATLQVLEYREEPGIAPDGRRMRLPRRFTWDVSGDDGVPRLRIDCEVDTPFTYGLGSGYVGGYRYAGEYEGRPVSGRGYVEYIDRTDG
ncbi:DUF6670 family protein [Solimonas sp. K1W22B-7]|uniref:DUF6670 family protein n=1 Tax=Solimonas sp. K1W22B-7 TaxID=2303331 RepID=UPI0019690BBD|nr:DUF6670 family protein [Solimonas sp. K1W22B-7]